MSTPVDAIVARAQELDRDELEWWQLSGFSCTELTEAADLGVPVPDASVQDELPEVRVIVRQEIAARRVELTVLTGHRR